MAKLVNELNLAENAYWAGKHDGFAEILINIKESNIKLPTLAKEFKRIYGEEHFTHKWHIGEKK